MTESFWSGRRVFLTGHTGFKGGWLALWLGKRGAKVTGYALEPAYAPSLHSLTAPASSTESLIGDIRDLDRLRATVSACAPEVVFHLAAQPLVRRSYVDPVETYSTNVMGTVNLLEAVRSCDSIRSVVIVTSDKCYENREWPWGYRENEPMGGYDPYSNSKGCAELISASYRSSFFNEDRYSQHGVALATARAGNVIGGGDWSVDRLVPDLLRAFGDQRDSVIRNPGAIRPWQHVLEPLRGYMMLAEKLYSEGPAWAQAWNFGPNDSDARPVSWIADQLAVLWGNGARWRTETEIAQPHEANWLKLDCSKARQDLGWIPRWDLTRSLAAIVDWQQAWIEGCEMAEYTHKQIEQYESTITHD
ncbi:CDP-glucose 4,6-dehydratase [Variovorax sp. J22G73]|uniref:CDP-glucose 4,6-dehydratase n=1 Tax=unclassified Variovorax TaxID=663243 RepID=UPI002576C8B4|nr:MULTISPECIES: CDP-glucose 4,6-dehydratase [unclassified Variovorax]MDM0008848.1 CDP-glucose 4,6-dehydratase [Variovorax sp. J22R203]MDM0101316.1 CDP-glucose 4,6-dehydratase [Variovorax sp. J22G73]